MTFQGEHDIRQRFIQWAASQPVQPKLILPEVAVQGKKIDLVCVEGPLSRDDIVGKMRRYPLRQWLDPNSIFGRPDWVRRLGVAQGYMRDTIVQQLKGKKVWLVELKDVLTCGALGQVLVYGHHFARIYPELPVSRRIVACGRTDPVVEEVCARFDVETVIV